MNIECKIKREGGSKVDIEKIVYHFEPLADGAHVAQVEKAEHIDRFLSIADAYRVYHGKLNPTSQPKELDIKVSTEKTKQEDPSEPIKGSTVHAATYEFAGVTHTLEDIVAQTFKNSGLSREEWNELDEEDRNAKIDITLDDMAEYAELEAEERTELIEKYKEKFGRAPHPSMKPESLRAKLAE